MTTKAKPGVVDKGYIDARELGADSTGVVDSTAFAAAAAAAAPTGGRVVFPPGTYIIKNWTISKALIVEGYGATFKLPALAALDGSPIVTVTANDVVFRGITFDGNKAVQPADGFSDSFSGGANGTGRAYRAGIKADATLAGPLTVEDCTFANTFGAGLATRNVSRVKFRRNKASGLNFEAAFVTNNAAWGTFITGIEITDNQIEGCASGHASVNANSFVVTQADDSVITRNVLRNQERNGVKFEGGRNSVISFNTISGVSVLNFGGLQHQGPGTGVSYVGNVIRDAGAGITINPNGATNAMDGLVISGNTIDSIKATSTTGDGIACSDGVYTNVAISGNTITEFDRYGIYLTATLSTVSVAGNVLKSAQSTDGGIRVTAGSGTADGVSINGNSIDMTGATAINSGGIRIDRSAAWTFANLSVQNNVVRVGARQAFTDTGTAIATTSIMGGNIWGGGAVTVTSPSMQGVSADRGDASVTLVAGADAEVQLFATALTANRVVTLTAGGFPPRGTKFRIVRTGLGAFTLDVGGLKTIPAGTAAFVDVTYNDSAWALTGYGLL